MLSNSLSKKELTSLYLAGHSMSGIAEILKCSIHKVVYWMDKYGIKRRTRSEAVYLKLNPNGDPFKIKESLNIRETFLYGLGLGIYWGEGEKRSLHSVRVANTDPAILRTFIKFLSTICRIESRKLSYAIVCFNDSSPVKSRKYWAKELSIFPAKFGKIVQIPPQGRGKYKRKSQFGVCTVSVGNIKLKAWIMKEIDKIREQAGIA